ncbi:endonuclease domain-containing protein [Spirosoma luteum]|uniref:endonuclease domain-containing protein n=1 Tax=Spirosoma luteum TaxID=431553 RepID=UPI00036520D3|nr:endonuclease domain-containing protein [Spirosoma luteum]
MRTGQLNNLNVLMPIRKELRNNATESEQFLWQFLKGNKLAGRKYRRQHSIGLFILDFYCPSERLAIELDGAVHDTTDAKQQDEDRQKAIEGLSITVLRFKNEAVLKNINQVLDEIEKHFK